MLFKLSRILGFGLFLALSAKSADLRVGVSGAVTLTDEQGSPQPFNSLSPQKAVFGPAVGIGLPFFGLSFEASALRRKSQLTGGRYGYSFDERGHAWEIPLLFQKAFGPFAGLKPTVSLGSTLRKSSDVKAYVYDPYGAGPVPTPTTSLTTQRGDPFTAGLTAGAGVLINTPGRLQFRPEFRYTYWPETTNHRPASNQVDFVLNVFFRVLK